MLFINTSALKRIEVFGLKNKLNPFSLDIPMLDQAKILLKKATNKCWQPKKLLKNWRKTCPHYWLLKLIIGKLG